MGGRRPVIAGLRCQFMPCSETWFINPRWGLWVNSGGEKGEEPPGHYKDVVQRLYDIHEEFVAEPDEQKRIALENEIFDIFAEELLSITALVRPWDEPHTFYHYYHNRVKNVPDPSGPETAYSVSPMWSIQE